MKTHSKTKTNSYKYVLIQDEGGLDIIRVAKQLLQSLSATHLVQMASCRTPVKVAA